MPKFALTPRSDRRHRRVPPQLPRRRLRRVAQTPPTIVVGNATAGEAYFNETCALVPFGDRRPAGHGHAHRRPAHAAAVVADARQRAGRGAPPPAHVRAADARPSRCPAGEKVEGELERMDDFVVSLTTADGSAPLVPHRRRGTKVERRRPAAAARDLLRKYTRRGHPQRHRVSGDTEMTNDSELRSSRRGRSLVAAARRVLCASRPGSTRRGILKPLADSWPTYSGDYTGRRYSALTQINQSNVKNLTLAWTRG